MQQQGWPCSHLNNGEFAPTGLPRYPRRDVKYTAFYCVLIGTYYVCMQQQHWYTTTFFPQIFAQCIAFHLVFIYLCRFLFKWRSLVNWPKQCICWTCGNMHWVYVDNSVWWLLGWSRCQCFVQATWVLTIWYVVCPQVNGGLIARVNIKIYLVLVRKKKQKQRQCRCKMTIPLTQDGIIHYKT